MPSRTRPLRGTPNGRPRPFRHGRALGRLLGLCASVAAFAAAPTAASACASPATVKSFQGTAHMQLGPVSATGEFPGAKQEFETVTLARAAYNLHVHLKKEFVQKGSAFFKGTMTGGNVIVGDSINDGETGNEAKAEYSGPLGAHAPNYGYADLVLSKPKCKYNLTLSFGVKTSLSGDEAVWSNPEAQGEASSGLEPIPHSLKLSDNGQMDAYLSCQNVLKQACYEFNGTWVSEFIPLSLCHSVVPTANGNCADDTQPVTTAGVGWKLSPTFEKKKK
jgi:hypothetical protein